MQTRIGNLFIAIGVIFVVWMAIHNSQSIAQPLAASVQWEYKVAPTAFLAHDLNEHGRDGWELVTVSGNHPNSGYVAVFKRPTR